MKPATIIGIILVALSIVAFAYQGITYTTREKIIDLGPVEATAEKQKTIPLPPVFGALALVGGVLLIFAGTKQRA
jgi:hypothetical protein